MMFSIAFSNISSGSLPVFFLHDVECIVNDLLRNTFLAIQHDVVDQAGDNLEL